MQRMSNQVKNMRTVMLMLFAALTFNLSAQNITVTGNVKDSMGEPIIGASVVEKGNNSIGTVTDLDGDFTLNVSAKSSLIISYIGIDRKSVV